MTEQKTTIKENSTNTLLEQYKLYVEMADRVSARRTEMNKFYISVLAGLLAVTSVVIEKNLFSNIQNTVFVAVSLLGILLCVIWIINIQSYRQLNSMKFDVIQEMESRLPFHCYTREWEILQDAKYKKRYLRTTMIEQFVPVLLTVPYIALLIYAMR